MPLWPNLSNVSADHSTHYLMLRILALTHTDASESCTFVRTLTPLQELQREGYIEYALVHAMPWNVATIRRTLSTVDEWDIIWMARPRHYFTLPILREARRLGKPVLIDLDDWLLDVPSEHGDADFFRTRPRRETIRTALRAADGITASTEVIAEYCKALGVDVHVLPNAVDCELFTKLPRGEEPLTIAFCGSPSHYEDVPLIAPALNQVLRDHLNDVRVVSVGCPIPGLQGLAGYTHHEFVAATEYPRLLSDLRVDIGLAPLQDTYFNRAKSDVKYLEYAATGAATIASSVAPYRTSIREDRGVLVNENTQDAWSAAIFALIAHRDLRQRVSANAYKWVRDERSIEATSNKWLTLFQGYADDKMLYGAPGAIQLTPGLFERALANIVIREAPYDIKQIYLKLLQGAISTARRSLR